MGRGALEPRACRVFGEDITYLFYGGVFYREGGQSTRNASDLPVAFLFDPSILPSIERYYPFDTGAIASGRCGEWGLRLAPFRDRFQLQGRRDPQTPTQLVYELYGSNEHYLRGRPDSSCRTKPDPLPLLLDFLSADLSPGMDQRQFRIECHATSPIRLGRSLAWVGFPEALYEDFKRLYEATRPWVPQYDMYATPSIFNPSEIAALLEDRAANIVRRFSSLPKA